MLVLCENCIIDCIISYLSLPDLFLPDPSCTTFSDPSWHYLTRSGPNLTVPAWSNLSFDLTWPYFWIVVQCQGGWLAGSGPLMENSINFFFFETIPYVPCIYFSLRSWGAARGWIKKTTGIAVIVSTWACPFWLKGIHFLLQNNKSTKNVLVCLKLHASAYEF